MNLLYTLPQPVVFGHRGASAHAPENTLAAFRLAYEQKAHAVEMDVKLTQDGQVIVLHDQSVDRTTDGKGKISEISLAQLKELDAGSSFSPQFKGEQVPTLDEVLAELGQQLYFNIELTNYLTPFDPLPQKAAELVRRYNLQERVLFSSFNPVVLSAVRRYLPGAVTALIAWKGGLGAIPRSSIGRRLSPTLLHPHYSDVTEEWLQKEKRHGRRINPWVVNDPSLIWKFKEMKVSGIITDDPLLAVQVLEGE